MWPQLLQFRPWTNFLPTFSTNFQWKSLSQKKSMHRHTSGSLWRRLVVSSSSHNPPFFWGRNHAATHLWVVCHVAERQFGLQLWVAMATVETPTGGAPRYRQKEAASVTPADNLASPLLITHYLNTLVLYSNNKKKTLPLVLQGVCFWEGMAHGEMCACFEALSVAAFVRVKSSLWEHIDFT